MTHLSHHHRFMLLVQWKVWTWVMKILTKSTLRIAIIVIPLKIMMGRSLYRRRRSRQRCAMFDSAHTIPALSDVPSHYHTLYLDAMYEKSPFFNTEEEDYNLDGGVEFQVGHIIKCRDAVIQSVKNYSIHRSAGCQVVESDQLKYHVHCRQAAAGSLWSPRVALRQNLGYWEVRRVGGTHICLAPTMFQDHRQLDSSLICKVILPLIQSTHLSVSLSCKVQFSKAIISNFLIKRSGW
ncbi:hypothetical protein Ahy_B09g096268 [Arachis hypogaea]|uniref:Uncharacterized protein n=1 Tax=Arachis hypogaea TaxID=3818 RepID=A0A444XJG5_ARAHY|nr:hypothetical protein Ahy_B09g096268 [Arachis hypogaea]